MIPFILIAFAASVAGLWLTALVWTYFVSGHQRPLEPSDDEPSAGPFVSVIVPARNEAGRILKQSVGSMLAQDYDEFEVIVVNDRSTDPTGEILKAMSAFDPRLTLIEGTEPDVGWLGKPNALQQGLQAARGEWIITTDADIVFSRGTLRTVVSFVVKNDLESLTLIPKVRLESFWERLFMPVFGWFCLLIMPPHRVNDPTRPESMGIGNFFMLKKAVLEAIDGFSLVRSEVAEDLKLAEILKARKVRIRTEPAPALLETRMYAGLREIWDGFSKNLFSGMKFSVARTLGGVFAILFFGVIPPFAGVFLAVMGALPAGIALLAAFGLQSVTFAGIRRKLGENALYGLLTPLGFLLFAAILLNSMIRILSGKGVRWKGRTIYGE